MKNGIKWIDVEWYNAMLTELLLSTIILLGTKRRDVFFQEYLEFYPYTKVMNGGN